MSEVLALHRFYFNEKISSTTEPVQDDLNHGRSLVCANLLLPKSLSVSKKQSQSDKTLIKQEEEAAISNQPCRIKQEN
jgi:hypothetical protein